MPPADPRSDQTLLAAALRGDPGAVELFLSRHAAVLELICGSVTPDARSRRAAYRDLLASPDFATIFAGFDGRGTMRTFLLAAVTHRFLFPRLRARLDRDPVACSGEFRAFFQRDLTRVVHATVEERDLREDAAQWIWEQLLDEDGRQLKAFATDARTPGYVVVKLKLLAKDFLGSRAAPADRRPRTLPEALAGVPAFDRDVYRQFFWQRAPSASVALLALRQRHPEATEAAVREARARVEAVLKAHGGTLAAAPQLTGLFTKRGEDEETPIEVADPHQADPFAEIERAAFRRAVLDAARTFSDREKLCLLKRLDGKAAGEIARELGIPSSEAYDLMRRVVDRLRKALVRNPAVREHIATVTGKDDYLDLDWAAGASAGSRSRAGKGADR